MIRIAVAWGPLLFLPAATLLTPGAWPRWALMWLLAFAVYGGCKWLTWRMAPRNRSPWWQHLGYLLAWPGLDAAAFLRRAPVHGLRQPIAIEWLFALLKIGAGAAVFFGAARQLPEHQPYLAGWVGMIGIVVALHFGLFHLLSCAWRRAGVDARPLMNEPLASSSVSEFWGRRWNTAFRDLTHRFLFRPLTPRFKARGAVLAGFIASGLVHDLVISVPAGRGYGGPTVFFLAQGAALLFERSRPGRRLGLGQGWRGRAFALCVIIAPVCVLFHPPFVLRVIVPFMRSLGAI